MAKKKKSSYVKKGNYEVGYKKPSKAHQIKKGEVRNPHGANASKEKRELRKITTQSIAESIKIVLASTPAEVQEMIDDPNTTTGEMIVLRAALQAANDGAFTRYNEILERAIGKVPTKVDVTSDGKSIQEKVADKQAVKQALKEIEEEV